MHLGEPGVCFAKPSLRTINLLEEKGVTSQRVSDMILKGVNRGKEFRKRTLFFLYCKPLIVLGEKHE